MDKLIECLKRLIKNRPVIIDDIRYEYSKNNKSEGFYFRPKKDCLRAVTKAELNDLLKKVINGEVEIKTDLRKHDMKILIDGKRYILCQLLGRNPYYKLKKIVNYDELKPLQELINLIARSDV